MIGVFVFDKSNDSTRDWKQFKPRPLPCEFHDNEFTRGTDVIYKGIVLVHRSFLGVNKVKKLNETVAAKPELTLVVISGSPQTEGETVQHRLYYRRVAVSANYDDSFSSCWTAFCSAYDQEIVDFSLLEPRDLPMLYALDILCLGYRLSHGDSSLPGVNAIDATALARAKSYATVVENKSWWMRGLNVSSLEELRQSLRKEVSDEISDSIISKFWEAQSSPMEAIKSMHELVKKQII